MSVFDGFLSFVFLRLPKSALLSALKTPAGSISSWLYDATASTDESIRQIRRRRQCSGVLPNCCTVAMPPTPLYSPSSGTRIVIFDIKRGVRNVQESYRRTGSRTHEAVTERYTEAYITRYRELIVNLCNQSSVHCLRHLRESRNRNIDDCITLLNVVDTGLASRDRTSLASRRRKTVERDFLPVTRPYRRSNSGPD